MGSVLKKRKKKMSKHKYKKYGKKMKANKKK
ncbi:AURKAIP1/COX24 domain-containing protein [bacterium]|nr:AURKAIP1/COX24 domain-containing protein [bacterium]MBT3580857.1 AURKAIP1/COX24 domain-containing protein [bacterium]MBT4552423.1 AURKAIP1/COX24 domain-containing protein [bacterium]MBT7088038.1 AURKAIP1/COX24 domain-containing protein [bacterium]